MDTNDYFNQEYQFSPIQKGINEIMETFQAIELLPEVKKLYPNELKENILSIRMYQTEVKCYMEVSEEIIHYLPDEDEALPQGYKNYSLIDRIIRREDLEFIIGGVTGPLFQPAYPVEVNAESLMEMIASLSRCLKCFRELFSEEGLKILEGRLHKESH